MLSRDPAPFLMTHVELFRNNLKGSFNKEANEKIIIIIMNIVMATEKREVIKDLELFLL